MTPAPHPLGLQLCPLPAPLEDALATRIELVAWHALPPADQQALLRTRGDAVRLVVTGGHIGCDPELMRALPRLGLVAINGVGFDKVDLALARAQGVRVTTTPGVLTDDVADLAVGLLIGLLRGLPAADAHVRSGAWERGERPLGQKVSGRRFGIVGLGRIGAAIAARLAPFGPVAYTGTHPKDVPYAYVPDVTALANASDVLVLACAATPETRGLVSADVLRALGADGYLVNIARGAVVDESALVAALAEGTIAGAALDVFADEPRVPAALRESPRVVLSPHIASATVQTRQAMADCVSANVDAFLAGTPLPSAIA